MGTIIAVVLLVFLFVTLFIGATVFIFIKIGTHFSIVHGALSSHRYVSFPYGNTLPINHLTYSG